MPRLVQVVRLVDDHERRRAAAAQRIAVELEELRRREHDIPRALAQRVKELLALLVVDRSVGAEAAQSERIERAAQRLVLIVGERTQRIDHQRFGVAVPALRLSKGAHRRGKLKAERLAAPRAEHRERVLPGVQPLEHGELRGVRSSGADQRRPHQLRDPRLFIQQRLS